MLTITLIIVAYLLGSISSAVVVSRVMHLPDPRMQGSGNPGATNVMRLGGRKAAAITLLGDLLKGLLPVLVARWLGSSDTILAAVSFAAFIGHCYPVFFQFKGGKGVATALGVLLALSWPVGLAVLIVWLCVMALWRISSLSALCAALLAPPCMWLFTQNPVFTGLNLLLSALLIWRHRRNIRNLLNGTEGKLGHPGKSNTP
jgi:glycerol-3-phosphate acyltransferase PlsY